MPKRRELPQEGRMIHVRIAEEVHRLLRVRVAELDTTIQAWVAALIGRELGADGEERATARRDADERE